MVKTVRTWHEGAIPELQDCFHPTHWDVFEGQSMRSRASLDE